MKKWWNRKIVCLLGSTKFKRAFEEANRDESAAGNIVLTVCWFTHVDGSCGEEAEKVFRAVHFDKIDIADEILVLNVGGYIGEHTWLEIEYCKEHGKVIRWLEPDKAF